jgi:type I restriction enzyme, R subunit
MIRIKPSEIIKKGSVPTNGSIFFTIFQFFMSGIDTNGDPEPYFGAYPKDYFDFIIKNRLLLVLNVVNHPANVRKRLM